MSTVRLLAGTRKGAFVLESTPDRESWTVHGPYLKGWEVADLTLDRRTEPTLYAAVGHFVYGPGIHRSTDWGETWEQVPDGPSYPEGDDDELEQIWTVTTGHADEPAVLYAGVADAGLFVTRDGGDSWTEVDALRGHETHPEWYPGKGGLCAHSICLDPDDPDRMWVAISAVGVLRTTDGGETWTLCNEGLATAGPDGAGGTEGNDVGSCVHRLVLDPSEPDRLFQQNHLGTYRSTNGGDDWHRIEDGLPTTFGFPMVMHPRNPDTLYTVPLESAEYRMVPDGEPAVYRTTDAGDVWQRHDDGLPTDSWVTVLRHAMATDALDPAGVYVGTTGGQIFHSTDAGDSWTTIDCTLPRILSLEAVVVD